MSNEHIVQYFATQRSIRIRNIKQDILICCDSFAGANISTALSLLQKNCEWHKSVIYPDVSSLPLCACTNVINTCLSGKTI